MEKNLNKERIFTRDFLNVVFANLAVFVGFNMTSTGLPVYISLLGGSDVIAGLSTTICTFAALLIRPCTGIFLLHYGRKKVLLISLALSSIAIAGFTLFPVIGIILTLRLFQGIGWGLSTTVTSTIAADTVPKTRFAEAIGYFGLSATLAMAIGPGVSISLIQNVGILPMVIIAASATVLSLILSILLSIPKFVKEEREKRKMHLNDFFEKRALLPALIIFLINCSFASIMTFIALHGLERNVDNIYLYFTLYAIATIFFRPMIGKVIDKIGFFMPGIFSFVCLALTLFLISISTNILMFCIAGIFGGIGLGTAMSTLQTMAVAAVSPKRRGIATSTFLFGLDSGVTVGAFIAGVIANNFGYANMFMILIIFPVITTLIFIIMGKERIAEYAKVKE